MEFGTLYGCVKFGFLNCLNIRKGEFFELICVSRLNRHFAFKLDRVRVILINEKEE